VVNYPSAAIPFTRTVEYKHFPNQPSDVSTEKTVIVHERTTDNGEPYYPVPNPKNNAVYLQYQKLAETESGKTVFVGRLASYKYFNMDQAVLNALEVFDSLLIEADNKKKTVARVKTVNESKDPESSGTPQTLKTVENSSPVSPQIGSPKTHGSPYSILILVVLIVAVVGIVWYRGDVSGLLRLCWTSHGLQRAGIASGAECLVMETTGSIFKSHTF